MGRILLTRNSAKVLRKTLQTPIGQNSVVIFKLSTFGIKAMSGLL